jgi:DNA-binding NtrC family response regulator
MPEVKMAPDQPLRILVVEDETLLRWSLAEILRRHGHTVAEAVSASTARDELGSTPAPIDVVFLDYRLPDSTDLAFLDEVHRRIPRAAVVMMTAYVTPDVVRGAIERGAYCVINKPFDLHEVNALAQNAHRTGRPH